ncbi:DNA cytosine methyltransferase [Citrobacter freundii]|nr:DNA cytosine methyltransferase [Citrobacter freundii]
MREIIVDNFAGGGGASTGIELAIGRSVDIAINHDENAIAMHKTNHPDTLHYCESVFDVDPVAATGGNPVGLAWFSPDCRHFSKAKGAKPVKKEIRGLAWIVLRWALAKRPRVMMLENVEEFKTWGPLLAGEMRPDPARTGETFNAFVGMLSTGIPADHPALAEVCEFLSIERGCEQAQQLVDGLGYDVDYRELRACDYGAPTIRKRFFMVMRCDGCPIQWPAVTHGDPKSLEVQSGRLMPWRTAAECIDWNVPALSIFDRKKPLAENTLKQSRACLVAPVIARQFGASVGHRADEPSATITAGGGGKSQLVTPTLIQMGYGERPGQEPRVLRLDNPLGTVTAGGNKFATVSAFLAKHYGGNYTGPGVSMDEPAHSVTTVDHHAVVASHLVKLRGTCRDGQRLDVPMPTITAGGQHVGEVRTFLETYCGESDDEWLVTIDGVKYQIVDIGMRMLQPHELYKAQGFPDGYVIDQDYRGNRYAKDKQVARCGNAVPPPFARALVEANLPELCAVQPQEVA